MVTTCAVKDCLRPPANDNPSCKACQAGMKPMTNPNSPHAAVNAGGFVPRIEKSGKPIQDGKKEMGVVKDVKPTQTAGTQQKPANNPTNSPKVNIDKAVAKKAVQLIFDTTWFNWDETPKIFEKIFKQYGNFISVQVKPSTMVGLPQNHKGTINISGKAPYAFIKDTLLRIEGPSAIMRMIETNPTYTEARGKVPAEHMMFALENDGKTFDFRLIETDKANPDMSYYDYSDGIKYREIPRWAIS